MFEFDTKPIDVEEDFKDIKDILVEAEPSKTSDEEEIDSLLEGLSKEELAEAKRIYAEYSGEEYIETPNKQI